MDRGSVGVVAIGRNEGERLRRCLASVPDATRVVYVDSGSTDSSVALAHDSGAEIVHLDMSQPFTAARARNTGFKRLVELFPDLELVQFVDGDCELEPGWFANAKAFLQARDEVAVVCGRRRERNPDRTFYNRLCDEEWNTPIGEADACGGDALMRVRAVAEVGAYDASLIAGEEPEMCSRMRAQGWRIWRLDAPMTIHDADMHFFRQWWRRTLRGGYGYAQVFHTSWRGKREILYRQELLRALMWTVGVLAVAMAAVVVWGIWGILVAPVLWLAQFGRLVIRFGPAKGAHLLLAKVAESLGAFQFGVALLLRRPREAIYYK